MPGVFCSARARGRLTAIWLVCAVGLASTIAPLAMLTPPASALTDDSARPPTPPPGRVALSWAALHMTDDHDYSLKEALDLASRFDLMIAMPAGLQSYSAKMKQANPELTLLAYSSGTQLGKGEAAGVSEVAFAHDQNGNRIMVPAWDNYLMEPTSAVWRDSARAECNARAARGGFDGCMLDSMGLGIFTTNTVTSLPAHPITRVTYSEQDWREHMISLAAYFEQQDPDVIHVPNAVQNSYRYWRAPVSTRPLVASMPAAQMEDFLRGANNPTKGFPTAENWKLNVDVITDFEARGEVGLFTTKLWSSATAAQVAQWQKYAMGSYLMGANGKSYFAFSRSRDKVGATQANLPYQLPRDIGTPLGAMAQATDGSWTRRFTNGMSAVNPTNSPVNLKLPEPMRDLSGNTVSSVNLPPHSGEVFVRGSVAPTVKFRKIRDKAHLVVRGRAKDDHELKKVGVAVRSKSRRAWLHRDGTWGARRYVKAKLKKPGHARSGWVLRLDLPPGRYKLVARAWDSSGNRTPKPLPHKKVRVRH